MHTLIALVLAMIATSGAISFKTISEAHERIRDVVHKTPVLTSNSLNSIAGRNLHFKCEFLQKTGSFKARGASNSIIKNKYDAVCTHSSGNHGQALAWAAQTQGIPAHIVMPNNSPQCKQRAVTSYGGYVTECEPTLAARESSANKVMEATGASFVHPYNNPDVMSGQGTVAIEFLQQVECLDAIIVPIGGGGLCSGVAIAAKALKPSIKIIAAEPAMANDAFRSKQTGTPQTNPSPPITIADGLKTNIGELAWPVVRDLVDFVVSVPEQQIKRSLRLVWERMKCVIEPSAAVGVAVATSMSFSRDSSCPENNIEWTSGTEHVLSNNQLQAELGGLQNVGVILCGGNIDLDNLADTLSSTH